jgi:hypothetical protein
MATGAVKRFVLCSAGVVCLSAWSLVYFTPFGRNLEYEYATVLSLVLLVFLPLTVGILPKDQWISLLSAWELPKIPKVFDYNRFMILTAVLFVWPLAAFAPGTWRFVNQLCQCSENGFAVWMLIQVVPTLWICALLLLFYVSLRRDGWGFVQVTLLHMAVLLSLFVIYASVLWFLPQKRLVSLVFGFWHGPIYDDAIEMDQFVVFGRMGLLPITALIWIDRLYRKSQIARRLRLSRCRFGFLWCFLTFAFYHGVGQLTRSGSHGFYALERELPQMYSDSGLAIYGSQTVMWKDANQILIEEARFHVQELQELFKISHRPQLKIFVYDSDRQKKLLFGGGSTDVTDVFSPSIHITRAGFPHDTLRHELVHALASYVSWNGIGFHPNMFITEGLAVALAPPMGGSYDLHRASSLILKEKFAGNIESLFSLWGFWSESGARSYALAGSFFKFLLERDQFHFVLDLYGGKNSDRDLATHLSDWKSFLDQLAIGSDWSMRDHFKGSGVLFDRCPHTKADYRDANRKSVWTRLRQPIGWDPADYSQWRMSLTPDDRSLTLATWRQRIISDFKAGQLSHLSVETWIHTLTNFRRNPPESLEDIESSIVLSDLYFLAGDAKASHGELASLNRKEIFSKLSGAVARRVVARLYVDELVTDPTNDPAVQREWRLALAGFKAPSQNAKASHGSWMINYLQLKNAVNPTVRELKAYLMQPMENVPLDFRREWYLKLVLDLLARGEAVLAKTVMPELKSAWGEQGATSVPDWLELVDRFVAYKLALIPKE